MKSITAIKVSWYTFAFLVIFSESVMANNSLFGGINAVDFGLDVASEDNSKALKEAIKKGAELGLPVFVPSSNRPYRIVGDILLQGNHARLAGIGGNAHLELVGGSLVVGELGRKNRGQDLRDLKISRVGSPGPAILVKTAKNRKHSRFTWNNIHIIESSGDGIVFEGAFLGSISGLWVTRCEGDGIVFRPGKEEFSNSLGANSIGFFGGEVQSCGWGIVATDTKGISFHAFAVEGNRNGGVWLREDNRNFAFYGGYFENNGKAWGNKKKKDKEKINGELKTVANPFYGDILIGDPLVQKKGNRSIVFDGIFFSDGKVQHKGAVWILNNQKNILFRSPLFWAYGSSPIGLEDGKENNSTGMVILGTNEKPDGKAISLVSHRKDQWIIGN